MLKYAKKLASFSYFSGRLTINQPNLYRILCQQLGEYDDIDELFQRNSSLLSDEWKNNEEVQTQLQYYLIEKQIHDRHFFNAVLNIFNLTGGRDISTLKFSAFLQLGKGMLSSLRDMKKYLIDDSEDAMEKISQIITNIAACSTYFSFKIHPYFLIIVTLLSLCLIISKRLQVTF